MTETGEKFNPTDPGPFQKYLFSGACYIKIGQCYSLVKHAVEQRRDLTGDEVLTAQLVDLWTDYLFQQTTMAKQLWAGPEQAENAGFVPSLNNLGSVIQQAGFNSVDKLIGQLDKMEAGQLDLNNFFICWASACDKAYAGMIRSEPFSIALGATINNLLQFNVLHSRPPANKG